MNPKMKEKALCRYNKFGFCKFSEKCRFRHNNDLCVDKNCTVFNCEKRHPKICIYHRDFGKCKFTTYCRYNHEKQHDVETDSERINELEKKISEVQKKSNKNDPKLAEEISKQNEKIKDLEKVVKDLQNTQIEKDQLFENKINTLENILQTVRKAIDEKDSEIKSLDNKICNLETKLESKKKDDKKKSKMFDCSKCDFSSTSSQGLKIHTRKKHTSAASYDEDKFPKKCDLCESKIKTKKDFNKHIKTHSYKQVDFKCEECDFLGATSFTMDVHFGKVHSENLECGLCECQADDVEKLNSHIFTCEIYKCERCDKTFANLAELKAHTLAKHLENKYMSIIHAKQSRTNEEEIDEKYYDAIYLFPELWE